MIRLSAILLVPLAAALASCGTISELQPVAGAPSKQYSKVVVRNFASSAKDDKAAAAAIGAKFTQVVQIEVVGSGAFKSVSISDKPAPDSLVIDGEVTRYLEGNTALRLLVGLGAGSSYFDADVKLSDGTTGATLGTIKVDKNSWPLGGGIAATQTVDTFMKAAAKQVAKDSAKFAKPH